MPEKLAILVPDGSYPLILGALLSRRRASLRLRPVAHEIIKDAFHDSSQEVVTLLRPYLRSCSHVLLVRDLHGSGAELKGAAILEEELLAELHANGWTRGRAATLVVDPEVEAWLRFDSIHLHNLVRERARRRQGEADLLFAQVVNGAIHANGGLNDLGKPRQPKEVLESVLETFGVQRSNALYENLAEREGLRGCRVASFNRLVDTLQGWFPET
jgi:hypothetical protein